MSGLPQGNEPIAALASGSGAAGVAVLRLSGEDCHQRLAPLLRQRRRPVDLAAWTERCLTLTQIEAANGEVIDDALVVIFRAPRSFTGEDAAEIHCHGGPYLVRRILELCFNQGFRPATPGEFTKRAFLHGKLDLTAAEGLKELVEAESHQQWVAARHLVTGRLKAAIETLRHQLLGAAALLEAQIDFPDEGDVAQLQLAQVHERVAGVDHALERLSRSFASGQVASRGLKVALLGAPNAGKSTLMNSLLGRDRAIVTDIAGTTRDWLEEPCLVDGRLIRLIDMAGLRDGPVDRVEAIGMDAARQLAREADVVLLLLPADASTLACAQAHEWIKELSPREAVYVVTKVDLTLPTWAEETWLKLSCHRGDGLKELRQALAKRVDDSLGQLAKEPAFVTSARHQAAIRSARAALAAFGRASSQGAYEEMLAYELAQATDALRGIVGEISNEDVLGRIFAEFCVGK